jgi:hypothetical protein
MGRFRSIRPASAVKKRRNSAPCRFQLRNRDHSWSASTTLLPLTSFSAIWLSCIRQVAGSPEAAMAQSDTIPPRTTAHASDAHPTASPPSSEHIWPRVRRSSPAPANEAISLRSKMNFYFLRRYLTTLLSIDLYFVLEFWNSPTLVKAHGTRFRAGLSLLLQVGRCASWLSSGSKARS